MAGQRSNQLNYVPTRQINKMRNNQCLCGFARFAYRAPVAPDCPKERDSGPNRPQTASKSRYFRALLRFPKQQAERDPGNPEFRQSGQNHQQNFRKSLSQKYPNSFSQNTKDHLHFPRTGLNGILNSSATVIPVFCETEQRPLPCLDRGRGDCNQPRVPCMQSSTWC